MYECVLVKLSDNWVSCVTKWTTNERGDIAIRIGSEFGDSLWVQRAFIKGI